MELFKSTGFNVLSEYNAPTYYGMDTWALAGAIKYGPKNATMTNNSKFMLTELWADIAAHYNPYLGNMVGPVRSFLEASKQIPKHSLTNAAK